MNRDAVLVHGFNVTDSGKATIAKLSKAFTGTVQYANYGWFGLASVLAYNDNIAKMIAGMSLPNSIGVGHSNGCALLTRAAWAGAPFSDLIFINPALEVSAKFPPFLNSIHVYYNSGDVPVRFAKLLNLIIPGSFMWGEMGRVGYQGEDSRVINHDLSEWFQGHDDVFRDPDIIIDMIHDHF